MNNVLEDLTVASQGRSKEEKSDIKEASGSDLDETVVTFLS
jgi:hypothetical protein